MRVLIVLLLSVAAFGQSAQVAELTKGEHDDATALYQAKLKADAAWDKFATGLAAKYGKPWNVSTVELDKDFRFVVPKVTTSSCCTTIWSNPCWNSGTYAVPAVSTFTGTDGNIAVQTLRRVD
jgi:hypothetical protein